MLRIFISKLIETIQGMMDDELNSKSNTLTLHRFQGYVYNYNYVQIPNRKDTE